MLLARRYGKWPHEVANIPMSYYLALRGEFIREKMAERRALARATGDDDVIEFDAEAMKSGTLGIDINEHMDRKAGVERTS